MAVFPRTSQIPFNSAIVNTTGSQQLSVGDGYIAAPPVVTVAGASKAVAVLYDGTDATGPQIATFALNAVGPVAMPNSAYATGLFCVVTSNGAAGTLQLNFTGPLPT